MTRRGVALIDLLVSTVLSSAVALAIGTLVAGSFARLRDRAEMMGREQAIRVAAGAARGLIEPLGADSGVGVDLGPRSSSSVTVRAGRGFGVLCSAAADHVVARSGTAWWQAQRAPVAGRDSLLLATIAGPDHWIGTALNGNAISTLCPDGSPGLRLPTVLSPEQVAAIGGGSPLRLVEPVELRVYASSADSWIGLRLAATGESIQPLAGPVSSGGAELSYHTAGGVASAADQISLVALAFRFLTERAGGIGLARKDSPRADSVLLAIALRGSP